MRHLRIPLVLISLLFAAVVTAQPAPARLTWVRYYDVMPGKSEDFLRLMRESSQATFDRLVATKTIAGWGVAVPMTHTEAPWTHVIYITANDWSAMEKIVGAFEAAEMNRPAAEAKRLDEQEAGIIRSGSLRDVILQHLVQSTAPPSAKPRYLGVDTYVIKSGRDGDALGLFNEWAQPLFTSVAAKGKLGPWGFSSQNVALDGAWTHMVWYFMSDLGALVDFDSAMTALGAGKNRAYDVRLRDLSEPEKHRSQILRVISSVP